MHGRPALAETIPDPELVALISRGDAVAFGSFYERHSRLVRRLAWRVVRNHADAEEVVQDVFMQVWQHAVRFNRARGGVGTWLRIITRTRAIDHLRHRNPVERAALQYESEFAADPQSAPETLQDPSEFMLRWAVGTLPGSQRIPLELSLYQELSQTQIAELLGQPLGTIKTRIRLSLAKVRNLCATGVGSDDSGGQSPFATSPTEYFAAHARGPWGRDLAGVRVLLVDPDSESRDVVRAVLEGAGAGVTEARRGSDALQQLRDTWPHVMLTELRSPDCDGVALLRRARALAAQSDRQLAIATFSARIVPGREANGAGFIGHVGKPVQPQALVDAVKSFSPRG